MLEKIKEALGEELASQVTEKLTEAKIELGITNDGSLVNAEKHDGMKKELKDTQDMLNSLNEKLKTFEGSTDTIEDLKAQIKAKTEEFDTFKADTTKRETTRDKQRKFADALEKEGFVKSSIKLLVKDMDYEKMVTDASGNIVDLNNYIDPLKTEYSELITTKEADIPKPPAGDPPKDESNMTDQEWYDAQQKEK